MNEFIFNPLKKDFNLTSEFRVVEHTRKQTGGTPLPPHWLKQGTNLDETKVPSTPLV